MVSDSKRVRFVSSDRIFSLMVDNKSDLYYRLLIGSRLKAIRLDRKESLRKAAEGMGINVKTLRTIENGEVDWWLQTVHKICKYYGLSMRELFEEEDQLQSPPNDDKQSE